MKIGEATKLRIIELCKINNITINKLSTISGITQASLNNIVSNRNKGTTVNTIQKICDGLNITIIDFFDSSLFECIEQELK